MSSTTMLTMKLCLAVSVLSVGARPVGLKAQSRNGHTKPAVGSICIAPPDRPTTGDKSLANPAAGNPISVYSIQIDKMAPVIASNNRPVRISSISTGRGHLVKIIGDGKVQQSFRFDFSTYRSTDLCLFFKSLYQTWSLWDGREGRGICKCK